MALRFWAHQAEARRQRAAPVVVAAAELEVEQQGAVGQQVEAIGVHQRLAASSVSRLEARGVHATWWMGEIRRQNGVRK